MDETHEIILNEKNNLNIINFNNSIISNIVKNSDESKEKSNSDFMVKEAGEIKSQLLKDNENCLKLINTDSFYEILGVNENTPDIIIRKNYKQKSIEFHPENNLSQFSYDAFTKVSIAFQNITKSKKFSLKSNYSILDPFICFELFISNKNLKNSDFNLNNKTIINPPNWENKSISTIEINNKNSLNNEKNNENFELISKKPSELINLNDINIKSINESKTVNDNKQNEDNKNKNECNELSKDLIQINNSEIVKNKRIIFSKKLKQRIPEFLIQGEDLKKDDDVKTLNKNVRPPGDRTNKIINDIVERNDKKRKTTRFLAKFIPAFILFLFFLIQYLLKKEIDFNFNCDRNVYKFKKQTFLNKIDFCMKDYDNEIHNSMSQKQKYIFYKTVELKYHENLKVNCRLIQNKKNMLNSKIEELQYNKTSTKNYENVDISENENLINKLKNEIQKIDSTDCEKMIYFVNPNDNNYLSYGEFTNKKYKSNKK